MLCLGKRCVNNGDKYYRKEWTADRAQEFAGDSWVPDQKITQNKNNIYSMTNINLVNILAHLIEVK